ncbi:hypothetical protein [Microbacterium sp. SA39]|uniref:hypothetical protein n=1 Tax=Microbacterium sp. SA39 TaxID=1263625 RepID=UPI001269E172|nr:hypothetical protein [Microbacterium sp. SA39]
MKALDKDERSFALTTSISFPMLAPERLGEVAERLDHAVYEATGDVAAVTGYFVAVNAGAGEIEVGLRFEGMAPRYINETAHELLESVLKQVAQDQMPPLASVREESALTPA